MSFTLGYVELPKKVYLAGNPTGDARLWNPAAANGVLVLNMGDRNGIRGIAESVAILSLAAEATPPAGLGLSPFDVFHLDLAASYVSEQRLGAVIQLGFTF